MSISARSPLRIAVSISIIFLLLLAGSFKAHSQTISITPPGTTHSALLSSAPSALVQFNNRVLFSVYTFGNLTAQDRADLANLRLSEALRNIAANEAAGKPPEVTVGTRDGQTVLLLDGHILLTITQADVDHSNQTPAALATSWASVLNRAFQQAVRERQPDYLHWAWKRAAFLLCLGLLLHGGTLWLTRRFGHKLGWPAPLLLWILLGSRLIDLFPQTRPLNIFLLAGPLRHFFLCLVIGLLAAILVRVWGITLRRLFPSLPADLSPHERTERTYQRRVTLARVAEVAGATLIWIAALLIMTTWLGVNLSALLTSAGLIGVALGFVAQDALRDFVASLYILADDRFGVGDTIQVGVYEGRVERLNLRATQLRDISGRLITISNRGIVEVANLTARWAQVDFKVGVSYYDDVDTAKDLLLATAQVLAEEWPERVLAAPELLGVDSFGDLNIVLRLTLRTPPGDQWAVARELRRRVKLAFDAAGLNILNTLYTAPPAPQREQTASKPIAKTD